MASIYGKDIYGNNPTDTYYNPNPPVYTQTVITRTERQENVQVVEPVDCTPHMLLHPMALLRWFQLLMFFVLQWLVQITCGNDACTMIMNVFGYIAMGQLFVLLILLFMSIICTVILVLYGLNAHRSFNGVILGIERLYAVFGILLFLIAGILGSWMAAQTVWDEVNYQGRGSAHIRPQWIAAAVIEFLMVIVYIFDLILQRREGYPFFVKNSEKPQTVKQQQEGYYGQQSTY